MASSVIQCEPQQCEIEKAIARLYSAEFQADLRHVTNPYGNGGAVANIIPALETTILGAEFLQKQFFDLPQD